MTQTAKKNPYKYVSDTDESLKTKSGGQFGLNPGAFLTGFEWKEDTSSDGEVKGRGEIVFTIGDKEYKIGVFPINKIFAKDGSELTDVDTEEYQTKFAAEASQQSGLLTHVLKAVGVSEEAIKGAFLKTDGELKDLIIALAETLPVGYNKKPVDLFLEYQWSFGKKEDGSLLDVTYPVVPKNMKGGYFVTAAQPGTWTEKRTPEGLFYVNEKNEKHPIWKTKSFMDSNKGKQQKLSDTVQQTPSTHQATTSPTPTAGDWI